MIIHRHIRLVCFLFIAVIFLPSWVQAGGTRIWEVAGFKELDKGKLDGTQVSSRGEVRLGHRANKLGLEDVVKGILESVRLIAWKM